MLENFSSVWPESHREHLEPAEYILPLKREASDAYVGLADMFRRNAGSVYANGLYRIHGVETAQRAREYCLRLAPNAGKVAFPFAFDWMGRHLAVDLRYPDSLPVIQFDPAAGKAYESGIPFLKFHDFISSGSDDIEAGEALSYELFREWWDVDGEEVAFSDCIGLKVPLFLGGEEVLENLSRSSMDVYWELSCQLSEEIKGSLG